MGASFRTGSGATKEDNRDEPEKVLRPVGEERKGEKDEGDFNGFRVTVESLFVALTMPLNRVILLGNIEKRKQMRKRRGDQG